MRVWIAVIGMTAVGCGRGDEGRSEATRITRVVNAAIAADADEKGPAAAIVAREPCERADLCRTRDQCANAFRTFGEGYALRQDVRKSMGAAGGANVDAAALQAKLDRAEAKNAEAAKLLDVCRASLADIERRYSP